VKKRNAIVESATRLFGSIGFDATTTLEIANEASVTEPLIYYHFKGKDELFTHSLDLAFHEYISRLIELPKHTPTEFQKIANIIDLHFQIVDDLPEQMRMIVTTCPAKLNDPTGSCLKNIKKARQILLNYVSDCLNSGTECGEFRKVPVLPTANMLVALVNGLLRQTVFQLGDIDGVRDATIEFCKGSLTVGSAIQ
jgi:AcrR family transcriptional regulator